MRTATVVSRMKMANADAYHDEALGKPYDDMVEVALYTPRQIYKYQYWTSSQRKSRITPRVGCIDPLALVPTFPLLYSVLANIQTYSCPIDEQKKDGNRPGPIKPPKPETEKQKPEREGNKGKRKGKGPRTAELSPSLYAK